MPKSRFRRELFGNREERNAAKTERLEARAANTARFKEKNAQIDADRAQTMAQLAGLDTAGALFVGESHEEGRNAVVALFPNRVERRKARKFSSLSSAGQEVEVTPISRVSSVATEKDGPLRTKVIVYASGNTIEFRFAHRQAADFRDALTGLLT
ncbi:MAG TPA: hypothetical protein VFJ19_05900 [Nocardioidaceae bacterium]|nr:hypothetical protein [Nocardioidaceae bacterium]